MHTIFLSVGGNLNNTSEKFEQLFSLLEERVGKILRKSSYYQSDKVFVVKKTNQQISKSTLKKNVSLHFIKK